MPRGAAVVYPKDAGQIVAMADIFPGAQVVEAGVGSGALTCSLLRAVGDRGTGLLVRAPRGLRRGRPHERRALLRGPHPAWELAVGDLQDSSPRRTPAAPTASSSTCSRRGSASTPWPRALVPGGVVCCYVATTTQLSRIVETFRAHGSFTEPASWESMVRTWHVEGLAVRPDHRMIGHTGFLVTSRRLADGVAAAPPPPPARQGAVTDGDAPAPVPFDLSEVAPREGD